MMIQRLTKIIFYKYLTSYMKNNNLFKEFGTRSHVIVDLETLSTDDNAVIVQLAAINFCPMTGERFSQFDQKLRLQPQLDAGREISESTLMFWLSQPKEAQDKVFNSFGMMHPKDVLLSFSQWLSRIDSASTTYYFDNQLYNAPNIKLWGNGPTFDLSKLSSMYKMFCNAPTPWKYYNERCMRTIIAFDPTIRKNLHTVGIAHDGIDDCINQINAIHRTLQEIYANKYYREQE